MTRNNEVEVPIKVSVVVPVFNPGEHIAASIDSLLAQTMPADELELIFVDDGSTDGTPALLHRLAEDNPQVRVFHEPASGWAGRPRNVGLAAATGEYVLFVDQDDWLGDEAVARMYAMARRNRSDIVIGTMIGINRGVPVVLFRKSLELATIHDSPIIDSLTPHKMFRRQFLLDSGLRFPEGPRRLEDHVFVVAAYFAAERISVLSDYACYFHISRGDRKNAGFRPLEPRSYLAYLAEALDIVDANTEPGPARDRLHRRWLRVEIVGRLRGAKLLRADPDFREEFVREARTLVKDRFSVGVDAGLSPLEHLVARLLRSGDLPALLQLATWESNLRVQAHLRGTRWEQGSLVLDVAAVLLDGADKPVKLQARNGSRVLMPPLSPGITESLPPDLLEVGDRTVSLDLFARHTGTGTEQFLSGSLSPQEGPGLSATSISRLPVSAGSGGAEPLTDGTWEIFARWRFFGWIFSPPVTVPAHAAGGDAAGGPALIGAAARLAWPHRTLRGNLRLQLTGASPKVATTAPDVRVDRRRSTASAQDHLLSLDLTLNLETDQSRHVTVQLSRDGSQPGHEWPGVLNPVHTADGSPATSRLCVTIGERLPARGRWKLGLSPDGVAYRLPVACPLKVRENGSVRLGRNPPRSYKARVLALVPAVVTRQMRALPNRAWVLKLLPAVLVRQARALRNRTRTSPSRRSS